MDEKKEFIFYYEDYEGNTIEDSVQVSPEFFALLQLLKNISHHLVGIRISIKNISERYSMD